MLPRVGEKMTKVSVTGPPSPSTVAVRVEVSPPTEITVGVAPTVTVSTWLPAALTASCGAASTPVPIPAKAAMMRNRAASPTTMDRQTLSFFAIGFPSLE